MTHDTLTLPHPLPKTVWASLFDPTIMRQALVDSFKKLAPQYQWRNPVMFVVYLGSLLTTILYVQALTGKGEAPPGFILAVTLWLSERKGAHFIKIPALWPLCPGPATGLDLTSLPGHSFNRIHEPGVAQGLTLAQRQADIRYGLGVDLVAK